MTVTLLQDGLWGDSRISAESEKSTRRSADQYATGNRCKVSTEMNGAFDCDDGLFCGFDADEAEQGKVEQLYRFGDHYYAHAADDQASAGAKLQAISAEDAAGGVHVSGVEAFYQKLRR